MTGIFYAKQILFMLVSQQPKMAACRIGTDRSAFVDPSCCLDGQSCPAKGSAEAVSKQDISYAGEVSSFRDSSKTLNVCAPLHSLQSFEQRRVVCVVIYLWCCHRGIII
eukprot:1300172-Pleurochrysis_carterae.AAC.1